MPTGAIAKIAWRSQFIKHWSCSYYW